MKRKNILLIALFALVLAFSVFGTASFVSSSAEGEDTENVSIQLNLGKDMSVKAYADFPSDATEVKAVFSWNGSKASYSDEVAGVKDETENGYLFVYKGLSAQHIDKTVSVEFFCKTGDVQTSFTREFSIKEYLLKLKEKNIIDDGAEYNEYRLAKLKTLANDILVYGDAARQYLGEETSSVADGVKGSDIYFDELSAVSSPVSGDGVVQWKAGIRFDYNVRPLASFALKEATEEEVKVEILLSGEKVAEVSPTFANGRYTAVYADFGTLDCEKEYSFRVLVGGEEKGSLTYSLPTLVLKKQSSSDAAANLIKATYAFSRSALDYASSSDFSDYVLIEAETGTMTGGQLADSGVVAGYMSGGKFLRNFKKDGTLTFNYASEYAYTSAEVYMIGSSGCVAEYDSSYKPVVTSEMKANELFTLSVNSEEKTISDNAVFEGKSASTGDYSLFGNRTAVRLCKTSLKRGLNQLLFTFKDCPYKNQNDSDASANYDVLMIVLNGREELSAETLVLGEKIEMENLIFTQWTDAERAGNTQIYPSYSSSGVSGYFSAFAFVKDIRKGGVLKYCFEVESDCVVDLVICATSTSANTLDLSTVFAITLNGEELTYSDSVIKARPSDGTWTPSETVAVKSVSLKAGVRYLLSFRSVVTAGMDGNAFYDYVKFVSAS